MNSDETYEIEWFLKDVDFDGTKIFWIGLTDQVTEGQFVWTSTSKIANYTNWNRWEPNGDNNGRNDEDCVHLETTWNFRKWNDRSCDSSNLEALCQKGIPKFSF